MNILITGASGFIGKNLVESLGNAYSLFFPSSRELNLLDTKAVEEFFKENAIDVVIHCAKEDSVNRQDISEATVLDHNLRMFFNLARCNTLYKKMFYLGSGAEYDRSTMPNYVSEDYHSDMPQDAYGFSKYIMNEYASISSNIYNLCLFGVFGKYEEYRRRFISNNICRSLKGLPMTLRQDAIFDYLYIKDFAKILIWFIENKPKYHRYNICSGEGVMLSAIGKIIAEETNNSASIQIANSGFQHSYTGSNKRMLNEIGLFQFTPLEIAVEELSSYYRTILDTISVDEL